MVQTTRWGGVAYKTWTENPCRSKNSVQLPPTTSVTNRFSFHRDPRAGSARASRGVTRTSSCDAAGALCSTRDATHTLRKTSSPFANCTHAFQRPAGRAFVPKNYWKYLHWAGTIWYAPQQLRRVGQAHLSENLFLGFQESPKTRGTSLPKQSNRKTSRVCTCAATS